MPKPLSHFAGAVVINILCSGAFAKLVELAHPSSLVTCQELSVLAIPTDELFLQGPTLHGTFFEKAGCNSYLADILCLSNLKSTLLSKGTTLRDA